MSVETLELGYDGGVLERLVRVNGSRLRFIVRREPWGKDRHDFVVCFGNRRLFWCSKLRLAFRAVRLIDYKWSNRY